MARNKSRRQPPTNLSAPFRPSPARVLNHKNKVADTPNLPREIGGVITCVGTFYISKIFLFLFIYINYLDVKKAADKIVGTLSAVIGGAA